MKTPAVVLTLLLMRASVSFHVYAQNQPVSLTTDSTIRIQAGISGRPGGDSVLVRVTADHFGYPLFWSLTVKDCVGTLLFYHSACACESDDYFGSEDYIVHRTYEGTRRDWFFIDLPERLVARRRFAKESGIFDRNNAASIYRVARDYLVAQFRLPEETASELTEVLALKMMNEDVTLLTIYRNPSDHDDPLIYLNEIRQFVPIGHW